MFRYKCPRCKGNQYSASSDKAHEPCIYCGYESTVLMKNLKENLKEEEEKDENIQEQQQEEP